MGRPSAVTCNRDHESGSGETNGHHARQTTALLIPKPRVQKPAAEKENKTNEEQGFAADGEGGVAPRINEREDGSDQRQ